MASTRSFFATHHALVGRSVRVVLSRDDTFARGVLYAIDPESGDVALLHRASINATETTQVQIVLGHAIKRLDADDGDGDDADDSLSLTRLRVDAMREPDTREQTSSEHDAQQLTQQLSAFLDQHLIPHAITAADPDRPLVRVFGGAATLRFPFRAEHIACANEQILSRLEMLLTSFNSA